MGKNQAVTSKSGNRRVYLACDVAEERIVPAMMNLQSLIVSGSQMFQPPAMIGKLASKVQGFDLIQGLGGMGMMPMIGKIIGGLPDMPKPGMSSDPANRVLFDNLKTAMDKMKADGQTMMAKSGVTIADMMALASDASAIMATGAKIDMAAAEPVMNQLARAVLGGTSTDDARTAFYALFAGTSVKQETIDKTFADLTGAISRSNLTIADLDLIAADRAAIDAALKAINDARPIHSEPINPAEPMPVAVKRVPVQAKPLQEQKIPRPGRTNPSKRLPARPNFGKLAPATRPVG